MSITTSSGVGTGDAKLDQVSTSGGPGDLNVTACIWLMRMPRLFVQPVSHGRAAGGTFRVQRAVPAHRFLSHEKRSPGQGDVVLLFACCSLLPCPAVQMRKMNHAHRTDKTLPAGL